MGEIDRAKQLLEVDIYGEIVETTNPIMKKSMEIEKGCW